MTGESYRRRKQRIGHGAVEEQRQPFHIASGRRRLVRLLLQLNLSLELSRRCSAPH
jgi:hypothetical protein